MINFFRSFFQSKLGLGLTIGFLVLIALAFASADVSSFGTFGGLSGTNNVAVVGEEEVSTAELRDSTQNALRQVQADDPTLTMETFLSEGGLTQVLDGLLDRVAISEFGRMLGLRAGDNLLNSEIQMIPAFRGPDGNFSDEMYKNALRNQGLTDKVVREDLADGLIARQVLIPAVFGAQFPEKIIQRYVSQLREEREGAIGILPSEAFLPTGDPTAKQLEAFYRANRSDFIRPERRRVRYAVFGADAIEARITPTDAEVRQRFQQNAAEYRARDERTFTQLIVPTKQAADSFRSRIADGASIGSVANEAGLETASIGPIAKEDYARQASEAVADAVFSADEGEVAAVARSPLGYHVVRVENIERTAARTLAQARSEIEEELRAEKQRRALTELATEIDSRINGGESLQQIARSLDLEVETTPAIVESGALYDGEQGETAPDLVMPLVPTAFQMSEGDPQIAEVVPGETFVLYEAASITPSAAAPLSEIRDQVSQRWKFAQGQKEAKKAADRILKRVAGGASLAAAMRAEDKPLPRVQQIEMTREEMMQRQGNPPLALMFAMPEGSAKRLEAPDNAGYFLVSLTEITPGKVAKDDPLVAQAARGYGSILGREYGDQLRAAIRKEVGIERNQTAVDAVRRELTGATN